MEFKTFVDRLVPKLKGICFRLNRGLYSLDEQDLFQEALVFLWEGFGKGAFSDKTDSYILQGCYFHLQNFIRCSKERISRVSIEEGAEAENNGLEARISLCEAQYAQLLETLDTRLVSDVIRNNGLTDREKQLLPLLGEGLTTREIGARLGVSHVRIVKMKKVIAQKCRKYLDE